MKTSTIYLMASLLVLAGCVGAGGPNHLNTSRYHVDMPDSDLPSAATPGESAPSESIEAAARVAPSRPTGTSPPPGAAVPSAATAAIKPTVKSEPEPAREKYKPQTAQASSAVERTYQPERKGKSGDEWAVFTPPIAVKQWKWANQPRQNDIRIEGVVRNNSENTFKFIKINVVAKDGNGKYLGIGDTYVDPAPIGPGADATFIIDVDHAFSRTKNLMVNWSYQGKIL